MEYASLLNIDMRQNQLVHKEQKKKTHLRFYWIWSIISVCPWTISWRDLGLRIERKCSKALYSIARIPLWYAYNASSQSAGRIDVERLFAGSTDGQGTRQDLGQWPGVLCDRRAVHDCFGV